MSYHNMKNSTAKNKAVKISTIKKIFFIGWMLGVGHAFAAPVITDAWIGEAPPVARHHAGFVTIANGDEPDVLLTAESPVAEAVELHTVTQQKGLAKMQRLGQVELAAGATLKMAPGQMHLMLINVKQTLKVGERVPLTLVFRKAGKVSVEAEVRPLLVQQKKGDVLEAGHSHHHHH